MADPSLELMAEVYDLLGIDLVRVGSRRFDGTGNILIPPEGSEVWEDRPQGLYSNFTVVRFDIAVRSEPIDGGFIRLSTTASRTGIPVG